MGAQDRLPSYPAKRTIHSAQHRFFNGLLGDIQPLWHHLFGWRRWQLATYNLRAPARTLLAASDLANRSSPPVTSGLSTDPDKVELQIAMMKSPQGIRLSEYWRRKLGGVLPVLDFPSGRSHQRLRTYTCSEAKFSLTPQFTKELKLLAKARGVTLFVLLLAVYKVLLYHYTGQSDVLVATPVLGRRNGGWRDVVGHFVNTIVIRSDLSRSPPFGALLLELRDDVLDASYCQKLWIGRAVNQGRRRHKGRERILRVTTNHTHSPVVAGRRIRSWKNLR